MLVQGVMPISSPLERAVSGFSSCVQRIFRHNIVPNLGERQDSVGNSYELAKDLVHC